MPRRTERRDCAGEGIMDVDDWHRINDAEMALLKAVYSYYDHLKTCGCGPLPPMIHAEYLKCVQAHQAANPAQRSGGADGE